MLGLILYDHFQVGWVEGNEKHYAKKMLLSTSNYFQNGLVEWNMIHFVSEHRINTNCARAWLKRTVKKFQKTVFI